MHSLINSLVSNFERGTMTRRQLIAALAGVTAAAGLAPRVEARDDEPTFQAKSLNHIALSVTDVGRARDFYVKHLGLTVTQQGRSNCFLNVGPHFLALFKAQTAGLNHYCYTVNEYNADTATETLRAAGFTPRRAENRVYFRDSEGLEVQLSAPNG